MSSASLIALKRGIRVLSPCFSPDERHFAFCSLVVGAKWLHIHELDTGACVFETRIHPHSFTLGWTAGGHLLTLSERSPLRVEARSPKGKVVASFTLPDASFDDYHRLYIAPEGDRALISAPQRKDDKRYPNGAPGYAWIIDTSNLQVRRHVDMRDHYPSGAECNYASNTASLQLGGDALVFSSYASNDSESRHSIDVFPERGSPVRASLGTCDVEWLDQKRLVLYRYDFNIPLEPEIAPAEQPSQHTPIGAMFSKYDVLSVQPEQARVVYRIGNEIRSAGPNSNPPGRTEMVLPKALHKLGYFRVGLHPKSPSIRALVAYAKNSRTKATSDTPAKSFASIRLFDTGTGEDREVLSIGRLAPPRLVTHSHSLEVHVSPQGRWIAVLAQEEVKKYLSGYVAVVPS